MDLIDRQAAIDALVKIDLQIWEGGCAVGRRDYMTKKEARTIIERLPTVQPEITRCRDCNFYDGRPCGIVDYYNTADDFCSRAERRENG